MSIFEHILKLFFQKNINEDLKDIETNEVNTEVDHRLRFDYMNTGVGTLTCIDCNHSQELHIFTHGGDEYYVEHGYQCQECGELTTIVNPDENKTYTCHCSGILSKDEFIFCPKCKSYNTSYSMKYMT